MRGMNKYKDEVKFQKLCQTQVGRLRCICFKPDISGPSVDRLEFEFNGSILLKINSFYGNQYILNPGSNYQIFDCNNLTEEEQEYIWECHKASGMYI